MTDNRTTELHEVCGDDRFDLIAKAREKLLDSTNIESRPEEVAVLDSILFRCWQMGWLDQLRDDAATLGSGMLTAEQVMAIAAKHQPDYCSDTHVCFDWQAIADELNATTGGGECEWVIRERWPNRTGDDHVYGYETSCGARHTWWPDSLPNYCPTCGGRVKAVKHG